jgi:hypothetical protein
VARRLLLLVDGLLLVAAAFLAVRLYEAANARPPAAPPEAAPAIGAAVPAAPPATPARTPLAAYAPVIERNLFSPTRTETPPEPPRPAATGAAAVPPAQRHRLYGVVLLPEGGGRAYLEDIQRRRVFAYSLGDLVGDARLDQIKVDRVVLRRGRETFEVLLHDPAKPRQAAAPPGVQSPGAGPAGRPAVGRAPTVAPTPGPVQRTPVRPRVPTPPHVPPSTDGQESDEEE